MLDRYDLEPVFFAPFVSSLMRVEPGWIDYNGHLNMAYYNVLFDRAVDEAFELIGCGLNYVKTRKHSCYTAEVHVRYLRELHGRYTIGRARWRGGSLLLQHQRAFLADRRRQFLGHQRQQPRQLNFQPHVVIGDIDDADGALAERAQIEGEPIAGPGFLADG